MREPCALAPFYGMLIWLNGMQDVFPAAGGRGFFGAGGGVGLMRGRLFPMLAGAGAVENAGPGHGCPTALQGQARHQAQQHEATQQTPGARL